MAHLVYKHVEVKKSLLGGPKLNSYFADNKLSLQKYYKFFFMYTILKNSSSWKYFLTFVTVYKNNFLPEVIFSLKKIKQDAKSFIFLI